MCVCFYIFFYRYTFSGNFTLDIVDVRGTVYGNVFDFGLQHKTATFFKLGKENLTSEKNA